MYAVARLLPNIEPGEQLLIIGPQPIVLKEKVDERQLWLPFEPPIFCIAPRLVPQSAEEVRQQIDSAHHMWKKKYAKDSGATGKKKRKLAYVKVPEEDRNLYRYAAGVPQGHLQFRRNHKGNLQFQRLTDSMFRSLTEAKFAGWDLDEAGKPYVLDFSNNPESPSEDAIVQWAFENLKGHYYLNREGERYYNRGRRHVMQFEFSIDAVQAKLAWG